MTVNNTTERDFEMTISGQAVKGRVPLHMSDRFRIHDALIAFPEGEGLARCCAVVGMCWAGDALEGVPALRSLGYDVVEFGEFVYDALCALEMSEDIVPGAFAARDAVVASIPTRAEVTAAADPIVAQVENSTASS